MANFLKSLPRPLLISAPMVDHSALPFRLLVRSHGANLVFTEMLLSKMIVRDKNYFSRDKVDWISSKYYNTDLDARLDKPLIGQIAGNDESELVEAGIKIQDTVNAVDLNLGCPQNCAKRGEYGGYLLNKPDKALSLIKVMVMNLACPISVKIRRLPEGFNATLHFCEQLERIGVSMITVHARDVTQTRENVRESDWNLIKAIKSNSSIPIIANGGISGYDDVLRCLESTNADGVMSSEGLLESPSGIFTMGGYENYKNNFIQCQLDIAEEFLELVRKYSPPSQHMFHCRNHLSKILFRLLSGSDNFDIRNRMLQASEIITVTCAVKELRDRYVKISYDMEAAKSKKLMGDKFWYHRYRM